MYVISFPKAVTASNHKPAINVLLVNLQIVFFFGRMIGAIPICFDPNMVRFISADPILPNGSCKISINFVLFIII